MKTICPICKEKFCVCRKCGFSQREDYNFCPKCGAEVSKNCGRLYCIFIEREYGEVTIEHETFEDEPTRDEVLEVVKDLGIGYDDRYGRIKYWKVPIQSSV